MRPRLLGFLVIAYTVFQSAVLLDIVRFFVTGNYNEEWFALVNFAIWIAFLVGGFGLIKHRHWAKWPVFCASAITIIWDLIPLATPPIEYTLLQAMRFLFFERGFTFLLGTFFLVASYRIKDTSGEFVTDQTTLVQRKIFKTPQGRAYLAHGIFAGAICILLAGQIYYLTTEASASEFGGMVILLVILLGVPFLVIFISVIYFTLTAIKDWRIKLLAVVLLALCIYSTFSLDLIVIVLIESIYVSSVAYIVMHWVLKNRRDEMVEDNDEISQNK